MGNPPKNLNSTMRPPGVHLGNLVESVIECQQAHAFGLRQLSSRIESQPETRVMFRGATTAGIIHQHFLHELR